MSLFEEHGLKYSVSIPIKVALGEIEALHTSVRRRLVTKLSTVTQERDELSNTIATLKQQHQAQINEMKVAEADRMRVLRTQVSLERVPGFLPHMH